MTSTPRVLRSFVDGGAFDVGCAWISTHLPLVAEMPHGGLTKSGYGKDLSRYGFEDPRA